MALDATLGVFEIGILIAGVLFGVVTAQVYIHHKTFPEENRWIKFGLVDSMWLIELGHTMCVFHVVYFYTVTHYGDPSSLQVLPASIGAAVVLHGLTIMIVQGYFTYRIWRFTEKLYIPVFSCFLMFCQLLAVMTLASQLITIATKSLAKFMAKWEWLMFTVLVLRAIADITVSGSLVFHLLNGRRGALKSTVAVVDKLILWTIVSCPQDDVSLVGSSDATTESFLKHYACEHELPSYSAKYAFIRGGNRKVNIQQPSRNRPASSLTETGKYLSAY
ncbi:hypothetical protein DFJ43DRAFT_1039888 [Lentinula guzmanii]|uniref:Uncharacterized protein n=1 Tax=Lentinula guzmanii TaxID=2804957 RepID=A0AA38JIZ5_9AGAR|nr:hypothetical protein DFJ43DRAFT_1039888 [Lentinula guzmanii]